MPDDALLLLSFAGKEAGNIHQGDDRYVESIAETNEARRLVRGINIETPSQEHRLIGDKTYGVAVEAA